MASRALILRGDVTPFSDPEEGAGAAATNLAPVGSEISDPRLALVARLHRGVSIDAATAVVQTIAGPFIDRLPDAREREGGSVDVVPLLATNSIRGRERSLRDDYATLFAPITLLILSSPARM
jgi:hypothetical protein